MSEPTIDKVEITWSRGISEEWDGWNFRVSYKDQAGWLSGPYKSLFEAMDEIKAHLSGPLYRELIEVDDA